MVQFNVDEGAELIGVFNAVEAFWDVIGSVAQIKICDDYQSDGDEAI